MAKSAPSKRSKATSIHSRAARRATSPSIDIDKSLKALNPPSTHSAEQKRPSVLAAHHSAGVSRKAARRKALTTKVRRRQLRGMDRAEEVSERTARRLEKSLGQARVLSQRGKSWDEVNTALTGKGKKRKGRKGGEEEEEEEDHGGEWEDEEVDMGVEDGAGLKVAVPLRVLGEVEAGAEDEDGDEIL